MHPFSNTTVDPLDPEDIFYSSMEFCYHKIGSKAPTVESRLKAQDIFFNMGNVRNKFLTQNVALKIGTLLYYRLTKCILALRWKVISFCVEPQSPDPFMDNV